MDYKNYPPGQSMPNPYQTQPPVGIPATYSQPQYQQQPPPNYYQQQPPNYQQPPVIPTITVQPTIVPIQVGPSHRKCPSCNANIVIDIRYEATTKTHLWALVLCLFGLWPCVCVPYCMDSCKSINHYCSNCHAYLGSNY